MKKNLAGLIAFTVLCTASRCNAQWEAAGYLGMAHTEDSAIRIQQPAAAVDLVLSGVRYRGNSFQAPLYYGVRGGYFFRNGFGIEGEFTHLKVFAETGGNVVVRGVAGGAPVDETAPMNQFVQSFSISHGVNLLMANAAFRHAVARGGAGAARVLLSARLGAGATIPHPESTIFGLHNEHFQWGTPAYQAAASVEVRVWRGIFWMSEYKFTHTRQKVEVAEGKAVTELNSHHLVFGFALH